MAEHSAVRRTPAIPATAGLRLLPPSTRFILRAQPHVIQNAGAALGIDVTPATCRASHGGTRAALWLGPDEYLILAPEAEAPTLARILEDALRSQPHSLVDVSHRQTALEIRGPRVEHTLNSACPLDLELRAFAVGMCTRTVFGKAEIVLWRTAADVFRLEVWRSFTDYVASFLDEVVRES